MYKTDGFTMQPFEANQSESTSFYVSFKFRLRVVPFFPKIPELASRLLILYGKDGNVIMASPLDSFVFLPFSTDADNLMNQSER